MTTPTPIYSGECSLLNWGESSRDGRYIRLRIEDEGQHPFKGCTTGAESGQRFMVVFVPINSDNSPAGPVGESKKNGDGKSNLAGGSIPKHSVEDHIVSRDTPPAEPNIRLAMAMARDPKFQRFSNTESEAEALSYIKSSCNVTSRTQLKEPGPSHVLRVLQSDFHRWQRN